MARMSPPSTYDAGTRALCTARPGPRGGSPRPTRPSGFLGVEEFLHDTVTHVDLDKKRGPLRPLSRRHLQ